MADAVAEFYDPSGRLQVSASMLGFVCRRSGTGTTQSALGGNTVRSSAVVVTTGISRPIIAIRMDSYGAAPSGQTADGRAFATNAPVGTPFTYYIFDWTPALPANSGLFQLYRADGSCSFSSGFWPMKMLARLSGDLYGTSYLAPAGVVLASGASGMGGHSHLYGEPQCAMGPNGELYPEVQPIDNPDMQNCRQVVGNIDGKLYGGMVTEGGQRLTVDHVSWDDVYASFGSYNDYVAYYNGGWDSPSTIMAIDVTGIPVGATFF